MRDILRCINFTTTGFK